MEYNNKRSFMLVIRQKSIMDRGSKKVLFCFYFLSHLSNEVFYEMVAFLLCNEKVFIDQLGRSSSDAQIEQRDRTDSSQNGAQF